jgi:membrane protein implicated in regulation of membrane protease activity
MMKSLAPIALTGIATAILWKILQILMAPVVAWIIGILALGLKIGLAVAFACLVIYGIRRVMRSRAESEAEA